MDSAHIPHRPRPSHSASDTPGKMQPSRSPGNDRHIRKRVPDKYCRLSVLHPLHCFVPRQQVKQGGRSKADEEPHGEVPFFIRLLVREVVRETVETLASQLSPSLDKLVVLLVLDPNHLVSLCTRHDDLCKSVYAYERFAQWNEALEWSKSCQTARGAVLRACPGRKGVFPRSQQRWLALRRSRRYPSRGDFDGERGGCDSWSWSDAPGFFVRGCLGHHQGTSGKIQRATSTSGIPPARNG